MRVEDVAVLSCPKCHGAVELAGRYTEHSKALVSGGLRCRRCRARYKVESGVPRFVASRALDTKRKQTQASYSAKWNRSPDYGTSSTKTRDFHNDWFVKRYGFRTEAALKKYLLEKQLILDAGTGLGRNTFWYSDLSHGRVFGLDISTAVDIARKKIRDNARTTFVQGDIMSIPFATNTFDFVACDQVLPCVADPEAGLRELVRVTKPGGHVAFYLYRRRGPIREFANDYLRDHISAMTFERAWKECEPITELGKALSDLKATIELKHPIPSLGIEAGKHDVQRLIFYNFLKCFWNDTHTFDENNLVNFDWYHPAFTYRHTEEEVQAWIRKLKLRVLHFDHDEPSGISVICEKPRRPSRTKRS